MTTQFYTFGFCLPPSHSSVLWNVQVLVYCLVHIESNAVTPLPPPPSFGLGDVGVLRKQFIVFLKSLFSQSLHSVHRCMGGGKKQVISIGILYLTFSCYWCDLIILSV